MNTRIIRNLLGLDLYIVILLLVGGSRQSGTPLEISPNHQTAILERFNDIRSAVSPTASNMNRLVSVVREYNVYSVEIISIYQRWNTTLAGKAQKSASKCRLEIDSSQLVDGVGQIVAASGSSVLSFITIIDRAWVEGGKLYDYQENSCSSPRVCSNYTQVIRVIISDVSSYN